MSEKKVKIDENHPEYAERMEFLGKLQASVEKQITCWSDMYRELTTAARSYMESPSKENADLTVLTLMCFVLALEELPEEGDILVIAKRMNEIMVMREDLTGAHVYVGEKAEAMRNKMALMGAVAMAKLRGVLGGDEQMGSPEDKPTVLH